MRRLWIGTLMALSANSAEAGSRQIYTPTSGPACIDLSRDHVESRSCPAPPGYRVTLVDEGNLVGISIGRADDAGRPAVTSAWRGAGRLFGKLIEWRIGPEGSPIAAIIRTWETTDADGTLEALRVFSVQDGRACKYGQIPARLRDANLKAAVLADQAGRHSCRAG